MLTKHFRDLLCGCPAICGSVLVGAALLVILFGAGGGFASADERKDSADLVTRGRIEPLSRVIAVTVPTDSIVIRRLVVDQGDEVRAGQALAYLDGYDVNKAELELAERNLELVELQRLQVLAGAKESEVAAQANVVAAKQAQLARVEADLDRSTKLYQASFVSEQALSAVRAEAIQTRNQLDQERNALKALTEIRGIDDRVASARIAVQKATVERTRAAMERNVIRAPHDGTILSLQARAGEAASADGVLRMADLSHLIVIAEVDESQVGRIQNGVKAEITGVMLPVPVPAHVIRIAHEVFRQKRPESDILIGRDARIVEVELMPDAPLTSVVGGEVAVRFREASVQIARP
jgi:HlyD family secretion protein